MVMVQPNKETIFTFNKCRQVKYVGGGGVDTPTTSLHVTEPNHVF